jgi:hypothetical protein
LELIDHGRLAIVKIADNMVQCISDNMLVWIARAMAMATKRAMEMAARVMVMQQRG